MPSGTANPDKCVLSQEEVLARVPLSRTTLWRLERVGLFPARLKISLNRVGWVEADVDAWLEERRRSMPTTARTAP